MARSYAPEPKGSRKATRKIGGTPKKIRKRRRITVKDVRKGRKTPKQYLDQFEREEVKGDQREGFAGFIYGPTESQMRGLFEESLREVAVDQEDLNELVEKELKNYRKAMRMGVVAAFVVPTNPRAMGRKRYVVIKKGMFSAKKARTEGDVRSILEHEMRHVRDGKNGVVIDGIDIYKAVEEGAISTGFFNAILEVRALHPQLEIVIGDWVNGKGKKFSKGHFYCATFQYFSNATLLSMGATNDLEKQLARAVLRQYGSIRPDRFIPNEDGSFTMVLAITGFKRDVVLDIKVTLKEEQGIELPRHLRRLKERAKRRRR